MIAEDHATGGRNVAFIAEKNARFISQCIRSIFRHKPERNWPSPLEHASSQPEAALARATKFTYRCFVSNTMHNVSRNGNLNSGRFHARDQPATAALFQRSAGARHDSRRGR